MLARGNGSDAHTTVKPDQDHVLGKNRAEEEESRYEIVPACALESSDEATDGRDFEGVIQASCGREAGAPNLLEPTATATTSKS